MCGGGGTPAPPAAVDPKVQADADAAAATASENDQIAANKRRKRAQGNLLADLGSGLDTLGGVGGSILGSAFASSGGGGGSTVAGGTASNTAASILSSAAAGLNLPTPRVTNLNDV